MYADYSQENTQDNSYNNSHQSDKEKIKRIVFIVLIFVILLILIVVIVKGCSKKETENINGVSNGEQNVSIAINFQSISLEVGESRKLYADVIMSKNKNPILVWTSEDSNIASVNDEGVVMTHSEGVTNIIVTYTENGKVYTNKCQVTVTKKETTVVSLEKIEIEQENIQMKKGNKLLLQVSTYPVEAKIDDLIYETDNRSVATISSDGYINAIGVGTTTITVKTKEGISDSVTLTVLDEGVTVINPIDFQLLGLSNSLTVGSKATIYSIITPTNATNTKLTWTSTNPLVASVDNNGVVTGISAGKTIIMASTSNNISKMIEVEVLSNEVKVTGISIAEGNSLNMTVGGTKKITPVITPDNATNKNIIYTSTNQSVATVDSNGMIYAISEGVTSIRVLTSDQNKMAYMTVTVTKASTKNEGSSSSSSSSSSGSSSGSSGSGSSSSGSGADTCSNLDETKIVTVSSNTGNVYDSPKYSMNDALNNKASKDVVVTIKSIHSCVTKIEYSINTTSNYKTIKKGETFTVSDNGVNTFYIRGTLSDGSKLTKKYYVAIEKNTLSLSLNVSKDSAGNYAIFKPTITGGSSQALAYYCIGPDQANCFISYGGSNSTSGSMTSGSTKMFNIKTYANKVICFKAKDGSVYSKGKCYDFNTGVISTFSK